MKRAAFLLALSVVEGLVLASCAAPMQEVVPEEGDFAFLEVKLRG